MIVFQTATICYAKVNKKTKQTACETRKQRSLNIYYVMPIAAWLPLDISNVNIY